jgi:nitrite reductase/ring-hydroxylating ferredoxin subunit
MVQFPRRVYQTVLFCIFFLIGINGCKKDYTSVVPYVTVDMDFNPTNYIELNIPGGSAYFANVGFGGVIIFRDLIDSSNPFLAFDAACTYEVSSLIRVKADGSGTATCPKCGSQFILFGGNGSPVKGPASEPLKQYRTSFVGGRIGVRN